MVREREPSLMTQLTQVLGPNRTMAPMIVPPDGGWGWVIVLVGLIGGACVDGCVYCFYLFREPMAKELNILEADVSYLSSINTGFYFVGAVLACSFGNYFGFRMTMLVGAVATTGAFASGHVLKDIMCFYLIIGVIGGLGCGFSSVGGGLPVSFYFDKKRSIALGINACGGGLGGMLLPTIVEMFMNRYGWRNAFLFEGGILAFTILLALLIRPLRPVMVVIDVDRSQSRARDDSIRDDYSAFRFPRMSMTEATSTAGVSRRWSVGEAFGEGRTMASAQPTIAQIMNEDTSLIDIRVRDQSHPTTISRLHHMTQSRAPTILQPSASMEGFANFRITEEAFLKKRLPWYKCGCCRSKYVSLPQRPLMRTDLYYTGSLHRLPEYNKTVNDLDYHMNVTRVPTYYQIVQDATKKYTFWCCCSLFTGLRYLIDYTMFKSLAFNCLAICGFFIYIAFYLPYLFLKLHLEQLGKGSHASTLVSFIGFGQCIGRLLSGLVITSFPMFDARTVVAFTTLAAGISTTAMIQLDNMYFKGACLFVYGFTIGFYVPLRSLIIVDYFGLEKLTSATGVLIICVGLGSFMGPPIAESAITYTKDKNAPFYLCGISLLIASASLVPMKWLSKWENKRAERRKSIARRQI